MKKAASSDVAFFSLCLHPSETKGTQALGLRHRENKDSPE